MTAKSIEYVSPAKKFNLNGNHQGWDEMNYNVWLPQLKSEKSTEDLGDGSYQNTRQLD